MATAEKPQAAAAGPVDASAARRRFNVEEYYRMAEAGILKPGERVELIEGEILAMSPIGSPHGGTVNRLTALLTSRFGARAVVSVQNPVRLDNSSEPEPDLALLRPRADYYDSAHPGPADILLLIEVMDSSAAYDRMVKLGLYARSLVPEAWLVDLNRGQVESYRRPSGDVYSEVKILPRGQSVAPEAFPDVVIGVDAILG